MRIGPFMDIVELAELMGKGTSLRHAQIFRELLVTLHYSKDTFDIPTSEWNSMLSEIKAL
ncbi:hypothetical protein E6Q11_05065 [Candidatus Dojkabacteria bacterium]|uniref:Uncharacterized protein n=1 Tax=Candidatus Dojkabacteria bacterium TaxID=2099670 RepID=A0A5C7J404_9BACT|nr:MAG: hypothetical protein E6Q11_05065 [Candidatus Dojkabacteria bacterium]